LAESTNPPLVETKTLPTGPDAVAPDGSDVRLLLGTAGATMAHFELGPDETSVAVVHRTVDEIWYFVRGRGEMWRKLGAREHVAAVCAGVCITITVGTEFQFRSLGAGPLSAVAVTVPPWPGSGEATVVEGPWAPTVDPGPT
jgi:mannose-6-phosphate isomerase-like protein (cupin superfamily)